MSYPLPTPEALADQQATDLEELLRIAPDGTIRVIDARSPRSTLGALAKANAGVLFTTHLHLRWIADQVMPDTATEWLDRHAAIWGVTRRSATAAVGLVTFTGPAGLALPGAIGLTLSGVQWTTDAPAVIGGGGTVNVPVTAVTKGAAGNALAGAALALVSPIVDLPAQQAVVAAGGLTGGADLEDIESWRARVLAEIREPAHGGAAFDYARWAREAVALARVTVLPSWIGPGSVGVAFLMPDAAALVRVPTAPEIAALDAYLTAKAPVTAEVVTIAASLQTVNVTISVNPNTQAAIAAVTAAVRAFFNSPEFQIGSTLRLSRLSEAISAATGETWHAVTAPTADVVPGTAATMLRLGALSVTGTS